MSYGIANLIHVSDEVSKRVCDVVSQGGGGVSKNGKMWRRGELEFEAYMRMLDNLVSAALFKITVKIGWSFMQSRNTI